MMAGARPVFADIDPDRLTLDPDAAAAAVTPRTRAILPVHLYGQAADMRALERVAARHDLAIVEDACQAHLATADGRPVGTIGVAGAFSFYPTKNLGALGDGGAVVTGDAALAARIKRLRNGGQTSRYHHEEAGVNSRLDELQAAILRARLPYLPRLDRAPARHCRAVSRRAGQRRRRRAAVNSTPGTSITCFPCCAPTRDALQAHLDGAGRRDADSLPGPDSAAAGARARPSRPSVRLPNRVCAEVAVAAAVSVAGRRGGPTVVGRGRLVVSTGLRPGQRSFAAPVRPI